jgi:amino acid adenylation domain-containing protein
MIDIAERVERSCRLHRERGALVIGGVRSSYDQLHRRVLAIHSCLEQTAAASERRIGILAGDSLDSYAGVLAILRSGRAFVPLNPEHPPGRNASIVAQAELKTVLAAGADGSVGTVLPGIRTLPTAACSGIGAPPVTAAAATDLAYLMFTSGSTGEPKGVPITRGNLAAFLDSLSATGFGPTADDRVLQMFDLTFDFSIASYLAPLASGACVYTVATGSAKFAEVYRLLAEEHLTVAPLVPSVLAYLKPYFPDVQLPDLRLTVLCGEALFADVATAWLECAPNGRVANFYGPTEATVFALLYEWLPAAGRAKELNGVVSIGSPMPGNEVQLVDVELQPVPAGIQGELCLAGPQLTPGYWNDAARNSGAFFERSAGGDMRRYYRTGDLALADSSGDYYFCGRVGTQVKVQGYRVELGEVEYHARQVGRGCECVVLAAANGSGGSQLSLVVENYPGDLREVVASLRERVPAYMVPARALSMPRLPRNTNGKIDRIALQRALEGGGA